MRELTMAAGYVCALIDLAVSNGASRRALAERSGIGAAALSDRDGRVPFSAYVNLMRVAQELCADPALSLHFGESVDASEMSVTHALGGVTTMAEAIAQGNRYAPLGVEVETIGTGGRFQLTRLAGQLWFVDTRANPDAFPELTESTFARIVCSTRRAFGNSHAVKALHVTHAEPAYRAEYDRIFQVPVVFRSDRNGLWIDEAVLSTYRIPPSPRYLSGVLRDHADMLLAKLDREQSTRGHVEHLLVPLLHTSDVGVTHIAQSLGLSRQTLFRKLKTEGVTFEQVLDELRHRTALHYLGSDRLSVKQTAHLVGFSDSAAFSRAFKRWTGVSPGRTRRATPRARSARP